MKGRALITGAARRIGRATAVELAANGYDIIVHYNRASADAETLAHDIRHMGREACLAEIDLSNLELAGRFIPKLTDELGPLAVLVNNASLFEPDSSDPDGTQHRIINAEAPRILSESFFTICRKRHGTSVPAIVNLLDTDPSLPHFTAYNESKKALMALTLDMARRFAPNMRVNGVAVGAVLPSPRQSKKHFDDLVQMTPLRTPIAPQAIASAVCFLVDNPSITGEIIHVDGGAHLGRKST